jgi:hypothetical protein
LGGEAASRANPAFLLAHATFLAISTYNNGESARLDAGWRRQLFREIEGLDELRTEVKLAWRFEEADGTN